MEKHAYYKAEEEFFTERTIDERGLTEQQRRQSRDDFIEFILDNWMPWHKETHDFSLLEVYRSALNLYMIDLMCVMFWSMKPHRLDVECFRTRLHDCVNF